MSKPLRHEGPVEAADFSTDNKKILVGHGQKTTPDGRGFYSKPSPEVRLWDAATGESIGVRIPWIGFGTVKLSPDGKYALIWTLDRARLWDIESGKPVGIPLQHRRGIMAMAFSPDGKVILTGGEDGETRLWDAATSKPIGEPMHHSDRVYAAAFSPNGKVILSGGQDGTAWFWDSAIGRPIAGPLRHQSRVLQACFSQDGRMAMTQSGIDYSTIRLLRVPSPIGGTADRIELWAKTITGMELDTSNTIHDLEDSTRHEVLQELERLGGSPFPPSSATRLSGEAQRELLVRKYQNCGDSLARLGRWEDAIANYTLADDVALREIPDLLYNLAC